MTPSESPARFLSLINKGHFPEDGSQSQSTTRHVDMAAVGHFDSIPLLDEALLTTNRVEFLRALRYAITNVGFLYFKSVSFPQSLVEDIVGLLPRLFALSDEQKAEVALEKSPNFLGYSAVGTETTAGRTDLREQFEFATHLEETWTPEKPLYERLKGPSQYPSSLPQTETIVKAYIAALTEVARDFQSLVAESLGLPCDTFLPFLSGNDRLKLVRYPAVQEGDEESLGVGPHKDSSGWWTFLLQASPPEVKGLQVLNKTGTWIDVPNVPGTFVVNIGQAFEVVTHGTCKATTHRVLSGPTERFSIPFFQGVRGNLTKAEALDALPGHLWSASVESHEGVKVDSAFLNGRYDTWGESQLRTKIRSHREVGKRFYGDVYMQYLEDS